MSDLERRVEQLEARLRRSEDELAVRNLVVRYGLAVDAGDDAATMALFTDDAIYEVRAVGTGMAGRDQQESLIMRGPAAVGEMVRGDRHQSLLPNSGHTIGPVVVEVDGDRASAWGYSRVYVKRGEDYVLFRLGLNSWELARGEKGWRIARRTSQAVGHADGLELIRGALG